MNRRCAAVAAALLLAFACSDTNESPVVSTATADVGVDATVGPADSAEVLKKQAPQLIYVGRRGVSAPWFTALSGKGVAQSVQLGPRRGAGYGMGEGAVSYPDLTPDGSRVVVAFYPLHTLSSSSGQAAHMFALAVDGKAAKAPVKLAVAPQLHALERAYTDDRMAYVDGRKLFVARLDGGDVAEPILIARVEPGYELRSPRWLTLRDELTWTVRATAGGSATLFAGLANGKEFAKPRMQMTPKGPADYMALELADGRIIVRGGDDRLYAIRTDGSGKSPPLTPDKYLASTVGASPGGKRLAVTLRQTWNKTRKLVTVATDGSEADNPVVLGTSTTGQLKAIASRDGKALAWMVQAPDKRWAAHTAPFSGAKAGVGTQISTWQTKRTYLTGFHAAGGPLVGGRVDGSALRFHLGQPKPVAPYVVFKVADVVNHSNPWPVLSKDGQRLTWHANTKAGWKTWSVALPGGGKPVELKGPWYADLLTPYGLLHRETVQEEAVYAADLQGNRRRLSAWHDGPLYDPHLVAGGGHAAWHASTPKAGWYAAAVPTTLAGGDIDDKAPAAAVLVAANPPAGGAKTATARPLSTATHLVRVHAGALHAFALDGGNAHQPIVLAEAVTGAPVADPASRRAAFARPADKAAKTTTIAAARVDGSDGKSPPTVMTIPGKVIGLGWLQGKGRVLAATRTGSTSSLYAAAIDGSEAGAPLHLASELPGWFLAALPTVTGAHVLTVLSINATAVPHPDLLLAVPATAAAKEPAKAAYALSDAKQPGTKLTLWGGPTWTGGLGTSGAGVLTDPAGEHVLLRGAKGLYSARVDGSQAADPPRVGAATERIGPPLSPDGKRLCLRHNGDLVVSTIGKAGSQKTLVAKDGPTLKGTPVVSARWAGDSKNVVFLAGTDHKQAKNARLYIAAADGSAAPAPLHAAAFAAGELLAVAAGDGAALIRSTDGWDRSIYRVALDGSGAGGKPAAVTPIDDVGERLVALLP